MIKRNFITVIICCILLGLTTCYLYVPKNRLSVQTIAGFTTTNFGVKLFMTTIPFALRTDARLLLSHKIFREKRNENLHDSTSIAVETDYDIRVTKSAVNSMPDPFTELYTISINIIIDNINPFSCQKCNQV